MKSTMRIEDITKRTIACEKQVLGEITETALEVYQFIQDEFKNTDVSKNLLFQFVYCNFYTLDSQKVDVLFLKGYFELMESLKGTKELDLEKLLFQVYAIETKKRKFHYSFTSKLAHTLDNNIPIWDSRIAYVFERKLTTVKDNGVNGDNFRDIIESLQEDYKKIIEKGLLKSTLDKLNDKFEYYKISDTKKLDFIFWAAGRVRIHELSKSADKFLEADMD